jgi:phosphate-selective porin OprO/OprP
LLKQIWTLLIGGMLLGASGVLAESIPDVAETAATSNATVRLNESIPDVAETAATSNETVRLDESIPDMAEAAASSNETARLAEAIKVNDTNAVAVAIAANQTNLIAAAVAVNETNLVKAVQADEEAGGWESIFSKENRSSIRVNFYLKNGLYYEFLKDDPSNRTLLQTVFSEKRRITGKVGVKLQQDAGQFHSTGSLPKLDNETALRRFRLNTYGRTYFVRPITYGVEYGVDDGDYFFNDGYLWFHEIPYIKSLKVGVFKAPVSLEYLQSSSSIPMMERAAPVAAFAPGERVGIQLGGAVLNEQATVFGGAFGATTDDENGDDSNSYSRYIARATWLPVWHPDREHFIHVGASINYLFSQGDGVRYRARPESYLAPHLVDTGSLDGDSATSYGIESAWVNGPLSFQGEYFYAAADNTYQENNISIEETVGFYGGYVLASFFITGESRPYNRSSGTFGRLIPKHNFSFKDRHIGALEWTARASYLDLTDGAVAGGEMAVFSTGLNCYLTARNRLMLMASAADVNKPGSDGELYFIQTRLQLEF